MYKLKKGQEAFEVVDGPMFGKKFKPGVVYKEIPLQEKKRFAEVATPKQPVKADSAAGKKSKKGEEVGNV